VKLQDSEFYEQSMDIQMIGITKKLFLHTVPQSPQEYKSTIYRGYNIAICISDTQILIHTETNRTLMIYVLINIQSG